VNPVSEGRKGILLQRDKDCPVLQFPPGWYLHLVKGRFSMVMELVCTIKLKSFAIGSLAGGGTILASYILRKMPDIP
jgi:hypothetical protein